MNSARVGAWVLLPVMLLSSCTTASTGRTAAPPAPSQTRIEVQADPVAPASPPRPPVMPAPPAPPLSVGPVQPPPPPPAPPAAPPPPAPPAPASTSARTIVGNEVDPSRAGDEIVTQIVTLRYIGAQDAVNLLRPFVAGQGAVTLHRETNLVIITDTTANIRRLLDILKLADVKVA